MPPYLLVKAIDAFRTMLLELNRKLFPANVVLYEQFQSLWILPSLYVAARLDAAEHLRGGPLTAGELAARCKADPDALNRVMRALASLGIFRKLRDGRYALNGRARPLLNGKGSLRHMLIHHLGPVNWQNIGALYNTVLTGRESFSAAFGKDIYTWLREHPEEYAVFDRSMSNLSELGLGPLLSSYSFRKFKSIADIGGGEGFLLSSIVRSNPGIEGTLFDLPEVLQKASAYLEEQGMGPMIRLVPGDFLEHIPVKAEAYLLKNVLHNWNDEQSARILSNIAHSMPDRAKILVFDMIVPETGGSPTPSLLDIQMLVSFEHGRERTEAEFRKVVSMAGLRINRILPTIAPISIIEVTRP